MEIGTVTASCGGCKNNELCKNSRIDTMKTNGLPVEWAEELKGLKTGWVNSEIYWKIIELQKRLINA